jgi:hypothetical protein
VRDLPADVPEFLRHSDQDAPVPSWSQVTRSVAMLDPVMTAAVGRVVAGAAGEFAAERVWGGWSGGIRRSVALLIDKICHEGWLDSVGEIKGWPWDGGFFFRPRVTEAGSLADVLETKARLDGVYTLCTLGNGLASYLTGWNHPGWRRSWIENDCAFGSLHVGIFENGSAEVHFDLFNPLFVNGAKASEIAKLPAIGSVNRRLFRLHRKWEGSKYGAVSRTSANLYHFIKGRVPLCF